MKTKLVNNFTYIANHFRKNGKTANDIIDYAKVQNIPIYQRIFNDGSIGLKPQIKEDIFILIRPDGSVYRSERTTKRFDLRKGTATFWKKVRTLYNAGLKDQIVTRERFYIGSLLEETAKREYNKGGPVLNSVISYRNRKTKFPMTDIGGNMHNFNISRVKDEYGEFSMLYTENYPHT